MGIEWNGDVLWRWVGAAEWGRSERVIRGIVVGQANWLAMDEREYREEGI
jgi:hypothetical protein